MRKCPYDDPACTGNHRSAARKAEACPSAYARHLARARAWRAIHPGALAVASNWLGKPCFDCGKKKGPNQADEKRCYSCDRKVKKEKSQNKHSAHVEANYGITGQEYAALLAFQGGRCAICGYASGRTKRLAVDHDHSCEQGHDPREGCVLCVRGLLCGVCNTFVGRMRDNPETFDRGGQYLRRPPWKVMKGL
jgi:hypothetical protein